jgi:hypothetical protein
VITMRSRERRDVQWEDSCASGSMKVCVVILRLSPVKDTGVHKPDLVG